MDMMIEERIARAVLEALREPSDAMEVAGENDDAAGGEGNATGIWYAMIDAALSEDQDDD